MLYKQLQVLSEDEIAKIVDAAFDVLEKVGCRFDSGWAKKQFKDAGCKLDDSISVVRIPRNKMESFLLDAPRLNPELSRAVLHLPGAIHTAMLDPGAERPRPAVTEDVLDVIRISNALDGIDILSAGVLPSDVPPEAADVVNTSLLFQYSKKPFVQQPYSRFSARVMFSMAEVFYGSYAEMAKRAEMGYLLATTGPLRFVHASLELSKMYASLELPVLIGSRGRMGAEAPATIAGALVMLTAEFMAGVAYIMVSESPAPIAFADGMRAVDAEGRLKWNGPEQVARMLGALQIAEKLGFAMAPLSRESDSPYLDFAAGWEKCMVGVSGCAAGLDQFGPAGNLPYAFSISQLVLDGESASMMKKLAEGISVNADQLAINIIEEVGVGGNFLGVDHTAKHLRDFWEAAVFTGDGQAAVEKATGMLDNEKLELAIDEQKSKEIEELARAYMERCKGTGGD